jgi:hypothetical protein
MGRDLGGAPSHLQAHHDGAIAAITSATQPGGRSRSPPPRNAQSMDEESMRA